MKNEIAIYQSNELEIRLDVKLEDETLWLTQAQIVSLFDSSKANISEHIKHIFETGELNQQGTVRKFRTVQKEGSRDVNRTLTHYSLDVIISVGYRVNSIRGTHFRIWANKVLKDYLLKGYALNERMNRVENNLQSLSKKVNEMDVQIHTSLPPVQGVFFDGQVFDALTFVSDLVRNAKKQIVLIDNYIDDTVLRLLAKKQEQVQCVILTKNISRQLEDDIRKFEKQYGKLIIKAFDKAHDRFLIIDNTEVYHIGASLKDLGKKWFAFSKMDAASVAIINALKKLI